MSDRETAENGAAWEQVRATGDRRRVIYWRLTTGPNRKDALGAVSRKPEGVRALLYDWTEGNPNRTELGFHASVAAAKEAVERAAGARANSAR